MILHDSTSPHVEMNLHESSQTLAAQLPKVESEKGLTEDLYVLKGSCRGYVGRLGRQYKEIEVLLADTRNHEVVIKKFDVLKQLFSAYESKFDEYYSLLEGAAAKEACDKFNTQEANYKEFRRRVEEWTAGIKENSSHLSKLGSCVSDGKSTQISASSSKLREAKVKMELARRRKAQLLDIHKMKKRQIELDHELTEMQIENEITNAEVEVKFLEDDEFIVDNASGEELRTSNRGKTIDYVANNIGQARTPDAPQWTGGGDGSLKPPQGPNLSNPQELHHAISAAVNMPNLEMIIFSGDPAEFCGFINNHEANVGSKAINDKSCKAGLYINF